MYIILPGLMKTLAVLLVRMGIFVVLSWSLTLRESLFEAEHHNNNYIFISIKDCFCLECAINPPPFTVGPLLARSIDPYRYRYQSTELSELLLPYDTDHDQHP